MPDYAEGGYISGPGVNDDSVPILLSRGCSYMSLAQVRATGLDALRALFPDTDIVIDEEEGND